MAGMMGRLAELRVSSLRILDKTRVFLIDDNLEKHGRMSIQLTGRLRLLAVAAYHLDQDIQTFRAHLRECGDLYISLFERMDADEPIDPSYLSMITYQHLFDPLAAGDLELAYRFARLMGGREEIEAYHDNPFTLAFGYALKHLVEGELDLAAPRIAEFAQVCHDTSWAKPFSGYATVFQALLDRSEAAAEAGFGEIVAGHERLIKGGRHFENTPDEVLCVWGVGLANLARERGMSVRIASDWIPNDLIG